jgi:hypothetical protein
LRANRAEVGIGERRRQLEESARDLLDSVTLSTTSRLLGRAWRFCKPLLREIKL